MVSNHARHFDYGCAEALSTRGEAICCAVEDGTGFAATEWTAQDLDLDFKQVKYSPWGAYGNSKLANILFANELSRRLPEGSTANSLHPGMIRTNLGRHISGIGFMLLGLVMYPLTISVPRGAATTCYVAAHPDCEGVTGRYFSSCRETSPSRPAKDEALAERLWNVSEELVGLNAA